MRGLASCRLEYAYIAARSALWREKNFFGKRRWALNRICKRQMGLKSESPGTKTFRGIRGIQLPTGKGKEAALRFVAYSYFAPSGWP